MKSRHSFMMMVGVLSIGLWSPMAMAMGGDITNCYFSTDKAVGSHTVILEGSKTIERPLLLEKTNSSPVMIEKTVSAPVMVRTTTAPIVIEDRIVKQKHFFGLGIWPLFNFEIL